jgi:uncharacterized membrane protein YkvI
MNRTVNTAINWVVGFVLASLVAGRFRDRRAAIRIGIVGGTITGVVAFLGYEKPALVERLESGPLEDQ